MRTAKTNSKLRAGLSTVLPVEGRPFSISSRSRLGWRSTRAYTLVEVLIAMGIAAVVFAGFYLNLSQGFTTMDMSRENLRATQILAEQMETIRLYTWDQLTNPGFVPTNFSAPFDPTKALSTNRPSYSGQLIISNAPISESYSTNMRLVTARVTWTSANAKVHNRWFTTYVSRYGLHNYFY